MPNETASKNVQPNYVYIRIHLDIETLDDLSRARLSQVGVECLQDGGAFRAYGIIIEDGAAKLLAIATSQPHVKAVEFAAPPTGF